MDHLHEIHLSVRNIVEFIYRSGDLDNRSKINPEQAMSDGNRVHRMIQKKAGPSYHSEVGLKWLHTTDLYMLEIEGRADGIIEDYVPEDSFGVDTSLPLFAAEFGMIDIPKPLTYIDEIKGTYKPLKHILEPRIEHLAQAKCYAYIIAMEDDLEEVGVRVSYCNMDSHEIKYFHFVFTREVLTAWFEETLESLDQWLRYYFLWNASKIQSAKEIEFPYAYREGQKDLVTYVYQTIYHKKKLFLEAPTGVGKTISTIFPAVKAVSQGLASKIFYLTAKTITRTVAEEAFSLLERSGLQWKDIVITAKEKICINEECDCNPAACIYANGHWDRVNECLYDIITREERFTREVICEYARKYQVCPYELSLDISLFADSVICDYNYVFDPHVYLRRYFGGEHSGKYIFLIDEAHNLLDRAREMYSAVLVKEHILEIKKKIKEYNKELSKSLDKLNKAMLVLKRKSSGVTLFEDVEEVYQRISEVKYQFDIWFSSQRDHTMIHDCRDFYFEISHFIDIYEGLDENYIIYGHMIENGEYLLKVFNVDPSRNLKERLKHARSSVLFSATFLPIQYYKELLGGEKTDYEVYAHSVFDENKRGLFVARDVTSKYTRRGEQEYQRIADYIHSMVISKCGNYLAFFPSYAFMEAVFDVYRKFYEEEDIICLLQQEDMTEADREEYLQMFQSERKESILGFCVLGGIFSEGIDLKHDRLIGAAIVGTGLPQIGEERELLKDFFDGKGLEGFDYAYRFPGMNKVLQAAGRVIRTTSDIGVVLLLDERMLQQSYKNIYPREWKKLSVVTGNTVEAHLQQFWTQNESFLAE